MGGVIRGAGGAREVWCWGSNDTQSLGPTIVGGRTARVRITNEAGEPLTGAVHVAAGYHHACAVLEVGASFEVHCWGENVNGEVGRGAATPTNPPNPVIGLP